MRSPTMSRLRAVGLRAMAWSSLAGWRPRCIVVSLSLFSVLISVPNLIPTASAQNADLVLATGPSGAITNLAFSPDGSLFASGSNDMTVKVWETSSGRELKTFDGAGSLEGVAFSADGKTVIGAGVSAILLWDLHSGEEVRTIDLQTRQQVAFSNDRRFLALVKAGDERTVLVVDLWNGATVATLTAAVSKTDRKSGGSGIRSLAFSPDGKRLVTGTYWIREINVWDIAAGKILRTLKPNNGGTESFAFSPDGTTVAFDDENDVVLGNLESNKRTDFKSYQRAVSSVAFSPDGAWVASSGYDDLVRLWNLKSGNVMVLPDDHGKAYSLAFSPDSKLLVAGASRKITIWELESCTTLRQITAQSGVEEVAFSPEAQVLASGDDDGSIRLWKMGPATLTLKTLKSNNKTNNRSIRNIKFASSGKTMATNDWSNDISIWDTASGSLVETLPNKESVLSLAFSKDGNKIASGSFDDSVTVWDVAKRSIITNFPGRKRGMVVAVDFSDDGKLLASLHSGRRVVVWDLSSLKAIREFSVQPGSPNDTFSAHAGRLMFSPDKSIFYANVQWFNHSAVGAGKSTDHFWKLATGEEIVEKGKPAWVENCCAERWTKADKPLFFRVSDSRIRIVDPETWQSVADLISVGDSDWAVVTPTGLFDASPTARKAIHYVIGLEVITLEQIKDFYFVPGLLQAIINGETLPTVPLFTAKDLFPVVKYDLPQESELTFDAKLINRGAGIGSVQLFVNGKECGSESGVDARPPGFDSDQSSLTMHVEFGKCGLLLAGQPNKVELVTHNAVGSINSRGSTRGAEFISLGIGAEPASPPNVYIIGGGISHYTGRGLDLSYAARDAEDLTKALEIGAAKLVGSDKVHVRLLTSNANNTNLKFSVTDAKISLPTKSNFERAFSDFKNATPSDLFIVYLAGHGVSVNLNQNSLKGGGGTYLYLTQEATSNDPAVLSAMSLRQAMTISSDELADLMKQNKALKQALVLDTCAAGAAAASFIGRDLASDRIRAIDRLQNRVGFFVLMGSAADKKAYETSQFGHGLLTYSLLYGVKGGFRLRDDKFADIASLFTYAQDRVPELATGIGNIQRPIVISPAPSIAFDKNGSFDIGMFTPGEQTMIELSAPKPWLLRPVLLNREENYDDLDLTPLIREALRSAPKIAFVDGDEMPGAVKPTGSYLVERDSVTINLRLSRDGSPIGNAITMKGNRADLGELVKRLAALIQDSIPR